MKLNSYSQLSLVSIILLSCIVNTVPSPIFDNFKTGWQKAKDIFHNFACKIKDHKSCEHPEITDSLPTQTTIPPEEMIDIRISDDDSAIQRNVENLTTVGNNNWLVGNDNQVRKEEGKAIISVNTCAYGYRRDRFGVCREIV